MIRLAVGLGVFLAVLIPIGAWADAPAQDAGALALVPGITTHKTIYGDAIADARGMTLYAFDNDRKGKSTCDRECADAWVPMAAPRIAKPVGSWSIVQRGDGTSQWAFQDKPLYSFTGDQTAGDINGDGADGHWHAVLSQRAFTPSGVIIRTTDFGPTWTTADGHVLYMFINFVYNAATAGTARHQKSPPPSACAQDCAQSWKPLIAPANSKAEGDWSLVALDDGTKQWAWKEHPLYTYLLEGNPGDISGEGHWTYIANAGTHWEVANIVQ
jgi:predicted lipoprotein with Yx(FWY)xxD motif